MNSNTQKSNVQDSKMNNKRNTKENHSIESRKRLYYKTFSDMKRLDELASEVNNWELRYGHLAIGMPCIEEIEMQQRERLITALWYKQRYGFEDAEFDAYLQWKLEVLSKL